MACIGGRNVFSTKKTYQRSGKKSIANDYPWEKKSSTKPLTKKVEKKVIKPISRIDLIKSLKPVPFL